ncbi:paeninodin family lasso peptide [Neobacillus mesonae]|nr:paeninodin family lasso peptide [Neobacillus mesonae]
MLTEKKQWEAPELEMFDISETKAGKGFRQIDWISDHDADMYDPS